jgi:hypothetical protein
MALKDKQQKEKTNIKIDQLKRDEEENRAKDLAIKLGFPYFDLRIATVDENAMLLSNEKESREARAVIIQKPSRTYSSQYLIQAQKAHRHSSKNLRTRDTQ